MPFLKSAFAVTNRRIVGYYRRECSEQTSFRLADQRCVPPSVPVSSFWMMMFGVLLALFGFGMLRCRRSVGHADRRCARSLAEVSLRKGGFAFRVTPLGRDFGGPHSKASVFDRPEGPRIRGSRQSGANVTQRVEIVDRLWIANYGQASQGYDRPYLAQCVTLEARPLRRPGGHVGLPCM